MNAPLKIKQQSNPILTDSGNHVHHFIAAMLNAGVRYSGEIIADSRLHRFHIEGHRQGSLNGAYVLHLDGVPAGWFSDFTTGLSQTWRAAGTVRKLNYQELISQQARIDEIKHQREIEQHNRQEQAAVTAQRLWSQARPANNNHPYLAKKKAKPYTLRQIDQSLVIPLFSQSGRIASLQFIYPCGQKKFLPDGKKRGCFFYIGDRTDEILICEGYATGASLHDETGLRVVVAFDANNLLPVARNIRELAPHSEIVICGDNDESGVGQKAANEAAAAIDGKVLIPETPGADWNDLIAGGRHDL